MAYADLSYRNRNSDHYDSQYPSNYQWLCRLVYVAEARVRMHALSGVGGPGKGVHARVARRRWPRQCGQRRSCLAEVGHTL